MAQLVARLVRNEKVGGSNPPSSTTGRHPIRMSVFCMPGVVLRCLVLCCSWRRWCSGRRRACCGAGLLGVPVGGGPPASRPRCEPSARRVVSKPGQAPPPPTGTAAWPRRHAPAPRPGYAIAHGHRSQTLRPLRRSSSWWCLVYSAISHVIPSQLVQTLNSPRWDCNVFGWSRKVTVGNYVRNLFGCVLAAAHRHRGEVLRPLRRASHLWGQECCCVGSLDLCLAFGTKFALLGFLVVRTV